MNNGRGLEFGLGLTSLALHGARELTDMIAQTHVAIGMGPFQPRDQLVPDPHRAPFPYRIVAGCFDLLARGTTGLTQTLVNEETPEGSQIQFVRSIINGVVGDKLYDWNHPLATPMTLRDASGALLTPEDAAAGKRLVIFLHGLCLSEQEWITPAQQAFVAWLAEQGYTSCLLRYNSGRAIADNGREFSELLEQLTDAGVSELMLVGHSMGGLLIRSAIHDAEQVCARWLPRLSHAAYLASPHHGSHWEKLGHWVNTLGAWASVARPIARLGHIRSAGIRDLRHGAIRHEDRMEIWDGSQHDVRSDLPELPSHARHLALAGCLPHERGEHWSGDGLVPLDSALGHHEEEHMRLRGEQLDRVELHPLDHVRMLDDARVYQALEQWLRNDTGERPAIGQQA